MNENTDKTDSGIPVKQFFTKQDIKKEENRSWYISIFERGISYNV